MWVHIIFLGGLTKVAYELGLPLNLASMHMVFHVSLFKKCVGDSMYLVYFECLDVK